MHFSNPEKNINQLGVVEGSVVVDFGAGSGHYTIAAAKKAGTDGTVYAIDIQNDLLTRLKDHARTEGVPGIVKTYRGDLEHIGGSQLRDSMADRVIVANILFQVDDKETLLRECFRVLKPKGKALIVDWQDSFGGLGPAGDHVVSESVARDLATKVGFEVLENISAGAHHYGFVVRKPA